MRPRSSFRRRARHRMRSRRCGGDGWWVTHHPDGRELLAIVQEIMRESGDRTVPFDARAWLGAFLLAPSPALAGGRPLDLLHDTEGRHHVRELLLRMQSGAYG